MLRRFSIKSRLVFLSTIILIFMIGMILFLTSIMFSINRDSLEVLEDTILDGQKAKLQVTIHSLVTSLSKTVSDISSEEEQIRIIKKATKDIRFENDKSGYYFVFKGTKALSIPSKPSMEGLDFYSIKDPNGVFYIRELAEACTQPGVGKFVQYIYKKPGKGEVPKVSYAEKIPGTEFMIGTGVYLDNITDAKADLSKRLGGIISQNLTIIGIIVGLLLIIAIFMCIWITRSIVEPIEAAKSAALEVASGNFHVHLQSDSNDEVSKLEASLNEMTAKLKNNMKEIQEKTTFAEGKATDAQKAMEEAKKAQQIAEEEKLKGEQARHQATLEVANSLTDIVSRLTSAANQLMKKIEDSSKGIALQSDRIAATTAATEEMSATVSEVAKSAALAARQANQAKDSTRVGSQIIEKTISSIKSIKERSQEMKQSVAELKEQVLGINNVMDMISDIANRTNLLALNATIEAASAGEAGKGFAVVAGEVKELSHSTLEAAKSAKESIEAIQIRTSQNIALVDLSEKAVMECTDMADKATQSLLDIMSNVDISVEQIQTIAAASEQQSVTSNEIAKNTEEINTISNETATVTKDILRSTSEVNSLADELNKVITSLKNST